MFAKGKANNKFKLLPKTAHETNHINKSGNVGFEEMIIGISVKFRMVIVYAIVVNCSFIGFAGNGKLHEEDLWFSVAVVLDSMGQEHSQNKSNNCLGEFIITDDGLGPIQIGYRYRDFVDFFSPDNIKLYRSEPEGVGWVTYAEITMDGGNTPQIVVSSNMIEYGDPTSDLDMTVGTIAILRGDFETERGIKIGSSIEELLSKYEFEAASYFDGGMGEGEYVDPYLEIEIQELADVDFVIRNVKFYNETPREEELPRSAIIENIIIQKYFDLLNDSEKFRSNPPMTDTTRTEMYNFYDTSNIDTTRPEIYHFYDTLVVDTAMVEDELIENPDSFENIMIQEMENIVANAQKYYVKPTGLGGGGNSFIGYTIPSSLSEGGFGDYKLEYVEGNSIELTGILQDESGVLGRTLTIIMRFDSREIKLTQIKYN